MTDDGMCIYPDCLIRTDFGRACEHSCPHEERHRAERRKAIEDMVAEAQKLGLP